MTIGEFKPDSDEALFRLNLHPLAAASRIDKAQATD